MPSVTYMNNSAPFWDFVANLEQQQAHPFFSQNTAQNNNNNNNHEDCAEEGHPFGPFGWGYSRGFPFRGPPPPYAQQHDHHGHSEEKETDKAEGANQDNGEGPSNTSGNDNVGCTSDKEQHHGRRGRHGRCGAGRRGHRGDIGNDKETGEETFGPSGKEGIDCGRRGGWQGRCGAGRRHGCREKEADNGEGASDNSAGDTEGCGHQREHYLSCGAERRGHGHHGWGPRGHPGRHGHPWAHGPHGHGGFGPHHGGTPHGGRRGERGPWGRRGGSFGGGFFGGGFFDPLSFVAGLFDPTTTSPNNTTTTNNNDNNTDAKTADFSPDSDIFDTSSSFVIHVSLPGAKKEDVGVNWDPEKSELSIAGVTYRPGDEEFLKTLAMGERKVGPFERKIRLGTAANPAKIDVEGICAKLEDGVLRVEVPKMGVDEFVEIRKVDVE